MISTVAQTTNIKYFTCINPESVFFKYSTSTSLMGFTAYNVRRNFIDGGLTILRLPRVVTFSIQTGLNV
jgi:hypothetical protein